MTLTRWHKNGWLRQHKTSSKEILDLLGIVERDFKDAQEVMEWLKKNHPELI